MFLRTRSLSKLLRSAPRFLFPLIFSVMLFGGARSAWAVQFVKGPYLQKVAPNSITVVWETDAVTNGRVDYGISRPGEFTTTDPKLPRKFHRVLLTGLQPGTTYWYTVTSGSVSSATGRFVTAPAGDTPFRFAVYGDTRKGLAAHQAVLQAIIPRQPDFVLHVGDFVVDTTSSTNWKLEFFDPAAALLLNAPLYPAMGNHEYPITGPMLVTDFFLLPNNLKYYAFSFGAARFIVLNSCAAFDATASFVPGSAQYQWLSNELQSQAFQSAKWRFVMLHHPPFSARPNDAMVQARQYLVPLFEQFRVDVVFSGHDHCYGHVLNNGIRYIVTGGGGSPLSEPVPPAPGELYSETNFEHCIIDILPDNMTLHAYRNDGSVMDSFSLSKAVTPPIPTGLSATAGNAQVSLSWTASSGATSYKVKRSTALDGPYATVATGVASTVYLDKAVTNRTTYYYVISAVNAFGESTDSNAVSAKPSAPLPKPGNLRVITPPKLQ